MAFRMIVAPHVGAWIETIGLGRIAESELVAPHVGAWIETGSLSAWSAPRKSHPMWVRGLKPSSVSTDMLTLSRTPCGCVD